MLSPLQNHATVLEVFVQYVVAYHHDEIVRTYYLFGNCFTEGGCTAEIRI